MGVSCSADRNIKAKINRQGIWIEKLESNRANIFPSIFVRPARARRSGQPQPADERYSGAAVAVPGVDPSLSWTIIVARDIAHAKLKELIDSGEALPQYVKDHPIYYAGPAKTPDGYASGSCPLPLAAWTPTSTCCRRTGRVNHVSQRQPQPAGDRRLS